MLTSIPKKVMNNLTFATAQEVAQLEVLRDTRVGAIKPFLSDLQLCNIIFNGCSDGHRIHLWKMHMDLCKPDNGGCFHPFMHHGQGLTLAINFPIMHPEVHRYKINEIRDAFTVVKPCIQQIVITSHWPCKKAALEGLSMVEALTYLVCAKLSVRALLPHAPKIALYHKADTEDGKTVTDSVWAKKFIAWLESEERSELAIIRRCQHMLNALST